MSIGFMVFSMRQMSRLSSVRNCAFALLALTALGLTGCSGYSASDYAPSSYGPGDEVPAGFGVHGIDISKYQGTIDWRKVRRDGVSFAYIKATEGADHHDEAFLINWLAARDAGVPRGAYHFYYWCRPAHEQVAWFKKHVPVDPQALPPVLDVEWTPFSKTCPKRPKTAEVLREMGIFLAELERHYGKKPMIYTSVDLHRDVLVGKFRSYPMWVRSVAGYPSTKYTKRHWTLWQFTGTGSVRGIKGEVDRNVFSGTKRQFEKWLSGETPHYAVHRL
jgi:lysozyme